MNMKIEDTSRKMNKTGALTLEKMDIYWVGKLSIYTSF